MKLTKLHGIVLFLACASTLSFTPVPAFAGTFTFDENCNGTSDTGNSLSCKIWHDPISGMDTVLYTLPGAALNGLVAGDFRLIESSTSRDLSDVLRFSPDQGGVFVFSDADDPILSMADVGLPLSPPGFQDFERTLPSGGMGFVYTPDPGMPGFMTGGVTYAFTSDAPEPATVLVMALPLAVMLLRRRRSRADLTN